jgi:DNA-binding transcriptional MerR regulator
MPPESFTLTEVARRLDVPQHRLIHLCEKGVVIPQIHEAAGRGSSRVFSPLNFLELAVALRLRDMLLPVSAVRGIVHVLSTFGQTVQGQRKHLPLLEHLRQDNAPDMRVIVSDGRAVYFTLAPPGGPPKLFGGVPLDSLIANSGSPSAAAPVQGVIGRNAPTDGTFGGPEGSEFARMELSVSSVAKSLPID